MIHICPSIYSQKSIRHSGRRIIWCKYLRCTAASLTRTNILVLPFHYLNTSLPLAWNITTMLWSTRTYPPPRGQPPCANSLTPSVYSSYQLAFLLYVMKARAKDRFRYKSTMVLHKTNRPQWTNLFDKRPIPIPGSMDGVHPSTKTRKRTAQRENLR